MSNKLELGDLEFKARDFGNEIGHGYEQRFADMANRLLRERLEKAPEVFGHVFAAEFAPTHEFSSAPHPYDTHRARLVCIEGIKDEKPK